MDNLVINLHMKDSLIQNPLHNFGKYLDDTNDFIYLNLEKNKNAKKILEDCLKKNKIKNIIFFCESILFFDLSYLKYLYANFKIIVYHSDVEEKFEQYYVYISQISDLILVSEKSEVLRYLPYNFNTIPFQISFKILEKELPINKTIDLLFIGNFNRPKRRKIFEHLENKGFNIETYGFGTKNGPVSEEKMNILYKQAKITLNLTNTSLTKLFIKKKLNIRNLLRQGKGRYLEAMINECLVISEPSYDLEDFISKKLMIEAKTLDEFEYQINYYLNNEKEMNDIVKDAKHYLINNYSHENNLEKLVKEINKIDKKVNKLFYSDTLLFSFILRFLLKEIISNIFKNTSWSFYCFKRIILNFRFSNIVDLPLFFKYIFFK